VRDTLVTDLTIVTCLAPSLGRPDFDEAASLLQPLLEAGVPIVIYVDDVWSEGLRQRCAAEHVRLHASSPRRRLASFAFTSEITAAWETARDATRRPDFPSLDYFVATLSKMGMLHDQSIWNPFGTRHLVWIDADITASVHRRYFTDERLLELIPCLLRRFMFMTRPTAVADDAGTPGASRVQGQVFGGELGDLAHANGLYYQLLEHPLREGRLPTDESIFTQMIDRSPERFDRFVLQDNGLPGWLFEQMRTGRAPIERTTVY
jgi:hypothetical protein